jgi:hypothetical protein
MHYLNGPFSHYHTNVINIWTVSGLNLSPLTGYPDRYFATILLKILFNRPLPLHCKRFLTYRSHSAHHFMLHKSRILKSSSNIPRINPYHQRYTKFSPNSLVPLIFTTKILYEFYTVLHSCKQQIKTTAFIRLLILKSRSYQQNWKWVEQKDVMWEHTTSAYLDKNTMKNILQICMGNHNNKPTWDTIKQVDMILTIMVCCTHVARTE